MSKFKLFAVSAILMTVLAVSAFAQAQPIKIVLIDTNAFYDEKAGITKLVNAEKQLDTEFGARVKELQDGNTKLQGIAAELQNMQKLPQQQFNQVAFNTKQDEGERLQRELNYKKTELETAINKRRATLITPINQDIAKAIDEFSKQQGYSIVFDISKLAEAGALLFLADNVEVTKEFITFYNARPAAK